MTRELEGAVGRLRAFVEGATKYASGVAPTTAAEPAHGGDFPSSENEPKALQGGEEQ